MLHLLTVLHTGKRSRIPKGQSNMDNPEKNKPKTQHNMCWAPLYAHKHK